MTSRPSSKLCLLAAALLGGSVAHAVPAAAQEPQLCGGRPATIVATKTGRINGTPGDDVIIGTSGTDRIAAGPGNDFVCSGGGDDTILLGIGDDTLVVNNAPGTSNVNGGNGDDTLLVQSADPQLGQFVRTFEHPGGAGILVQAFGGPFTTGRATTTAIEHFRIESTQARDVTELVEVANLQLRSISVGSSASDINEVRMSATGERTVRLSTVDGVDHLDGLGPQVRLLGGGLGNLVRITLFGGPHLIDARRLSPDGPSYEYVTGPLADVVLGSQRAEAISAGDGDDVVVAGGNRDRLDGGPGNDTLDAGKDDDSLSGGPGEDVLVGGAGVDFGDGGPDTDTDVAVGVEVPTNLP